MPSFSLAQNLPTGFTFKVVFQSNGANNFSVPGALLELPGKAGVFVVPDMEGGKIWTLTPKTDGTYTKAQFASIPVNTGEDGGIMGMCFHPDYATNRKYYLKYDSPGKNPRTIVVSEFLADATLLVGSGQPERKLMSIAAPQEFKDHNGGTIAFGPDGYLYITMGDGGWDLKNPDIYGNGQNLELLLSKVLRINVNAKDAGLEYAIPADNPFVNNANAKIRRETWAYGFRNPYRMNWDKLTKELYLGDVGQTMYEEINIVKPGKNYGWRLKEGDTCFVAGGCANLAIENPMAHMKYGTYKCFVGGEIYRGDASSPFYGAYLFGDYTTRQLLALKKGDATNNVAVQKMANTPGEPLGFAQDSKSNIYAYCNNGVIYQLVHAQMPAVQATSIQVDQVTDRSQRGRLRIGLVTSRDYSPPQPLFFLNGKTMGQAERESFFRVASPGLFIAP